jgi:type I restriction enzyme S subunit
MANKAYPPSICPGIPRLGKCPTGWTTCTFSDILTVVERPVRVEDDTVYQLVTAKRNRGGIVPREQLKGREIKTQGQYTIRAGDFLIANRQIVHGACGIVPENLDGAIVSGEYTVLLPKKPLWLPWLAHFAHTVHFQQTCFQSSIGVDVEKMVFKVDWWMKQRLHVPPMSEQKKTAAILSIWDNAINQTRDLIEAAKCRKEALLRHLLTEKRRMNKKNGLWQKRRLGDVASINLDTLLESTDPDREFKYIDLSSIDLGKIELPDKTTRFCEAPNRARRLMEKGDILLATVRPSLQGYALVDFDASDCVCSTGFAVLRPKAGNNSEFIYQVLFSNKVQQQFHAMVTGSSYPSLNEGDIASVHVTVPDFSEQCAIAAILTTADDEVRTLEAKTAALERQKKGLMQKLLTGQVRVKM